MKQLLIVLFLGASLFVKAGDKYFLFCYFIGNGQDGLHFAGSTDGLNWEAFNDGKSYLAPTVGKDKLMRDPCIYQGPDGVYRMVWTSGWWDKIIGYASSKDLITWSEEKAIPVMMHEDSARNSWAPEVSYDEKKEEYFIFWATTIPNRHSPIAYTEREKDLNHRIYSVSTKDFQEFSPTKMFFNPDFSAIDATILKHNKKYYMFVKNENPNPPQKNIRITIADQAMGPYPTSVSEPITGNFWAEGPTPMEVGDSVYVYFDKYRNHAYGAVRSKDMTHWDDVSSMLKMPKGIRHGTAFPVSKEDYERVKNYHSPVVEQAK
jgi:beta-galactosidase